MITSKTDIEQRLLSIVQEFLRELEAERALRAVTLEASLDRDLGIDSLGRVELLHRIEKNFSIQLPDKALVEAESLQDLVGSIKQAMSQSPTRLKPLAFATVLEATKEDLSSAKTLVDVIQSYAQNDSNRPHIHMMDEQGNEQIITYGQLYTEALKIAGGLCKRGIKPGETIAIMLPTCEGFFYSFCGILLAGAIPVPIYPPFRADRIEEYAKREARILQSAQVRILITFAQAELLSNILRNFVPSLKEVVTVKALQTKPEIISPIPITPQDAALIQYTSGSTGDPKGVLITQANMLTNIRAIKQALPIKSSDVNVSWLPLYHDMGLMSWIGSHYSGVPVTIMSPLIFLTRPERWLWAIHYHRATISGGPNFAYELCVKKINPKNIEGLDLSSWRVAYNGAEAVKPKTLERFTKMFAPYGFKAESFAPVYGLAECTVDLTIPVKNRLPRIDKIQRNAFALECKAVPIKEQEKDYMEIVGCGVVLPDHEMRIVNDAGKVLPERYVGNIQFKGPSAMQGYYNNPAATQKIFHDGWWDTGDLGYLADKEIFLTGRKKDLIIKAGRNLYPEEVEEVVNQIPDIRTGCVIAFGVSDALTGTEKIVVVAETYLFDKQSQQTIRAEITEKMASFLGITPDVIVFVAPRTIPKTSSGKLQRSACKQAYLEKKLARQPLPVKLQFFKLALMSFGKRVNRWVSTAINLVYAAYVAILLLLTALPLWLLVLSVPKNIAWIVTRFWSRNILRLVGCPITIKGKEHLNQSATCIYVANHSSYADALLLLAILPKKFIFVAKKEVSQMPIIKTFIKKLDCLTVDRMDFSKGVESKNLLVEVVRQGHSVVIFPEGTFTYATGLRPFRLGAFMISAETNTPICPIGIAGMRHVLRGDSFMPKPGRVKVTVGEWLYPRSNEWNEMMRLHTATRAEIAKHCGEPVIDIIAAGPVVE